MRTRLLIVIAAVLLCACKNELDPQSDVRDLRVLGLRVTEPELLFDAPADATLTFEALVVDPRGGAVDYTWRFCPVESDVACNDYAALRDQAPAASRAGLDNMFAMSLSGTALPIPESQSLPPDVADDRGVWVHDVPSFTVSAPSALVSYHTETSLLGFGAGAWPSAVLGIEKGDEEVLAQKRVGLNFRDLTDHADVFAAELGLRLCTATVTTDCVLVSPRTANSNPVFDGIEIARGERADADFSPMPDPLTMEPLESIRIRPRLTEASAESYERLFTDVNTREVFVESAVEDLSVQWFASAGELQDQLTAPGLTRTLDTGFVAPKEFPATGKVSLWLVAHDNRGGVTWTQLEIEILP